MKHINSILEKQLALDYCCNPEDVSDVANHFTVFRQIEGRRRFDYDDDRFLKITSINGKILCTGRDDVIADLSDRLKNADGRWFMEAGPLARLNGIIRGYGWRIKQVHPFYIAAENTPVHMDGIDTKWFLRDEIAQFDGDTRFDEAFAFSKAAPDVLGVAAMVDGIIIGMAGASADSPTMWQIGINVAPKAEGRGIGKGLVTLLKNAVLKEGILPFYGTALSHIASQRVAIGAGFVPAWAELITECIEAE